MASEGLLWTQACATSHTLRQRIQPEKRVLKTNGTKKQKTKTLGSQNIALRKEVTANYTE